MDELERMGYGISAEADLCGCILVAPVEVLREVRGKVAASDFSTELYRGIYEIAARLVDAGDPVDVTIIQAELQKRGFTADNGQLMEIMQRCSTVANAGVTAELVRNAAIERRARQLGQELAFNRISPIDAVSSLQELIASQSAAVQSPLDAALSFADYVSDVADGKQKPFQSTGYSNLDEILGGGIIQGGLITIAGRPSSGKSTVGVNIAENVAAMGGKVLYFSFEMPSRQLWARRVAIASGLSFGKMLNGKITPQEREAFFTRFNSAASDLSGRQFFIYDKPCTIEDVERVTRSMDELSLVVVDHIGLISRDGKGASLYEASTFNTHRLKQIALSTGIPIIALSQLNRGCEQRPDKLPTMADLRDSGATEEDSDVVALVYREGMYLPEDKKPKAWETQPLELIIDKNRHARQGTARFTFTGINARVREVAYEH